MAALPERTAEPAWQTWPNGHSQSQVGCTVVIAWPSAKRTEVFIAVKGPAPTL